MQMRTSDQIDKLAEALAKAQRVMSHPKKNKTAVVPLKTGGQYSYDYADLADVLDAIREPFGANGLSLVQVPYVDRSNPEATCIGVITRIMHDSGQWIEGPFAMPAADAKPQSIGSIITYCRRYTAGPMSGVTSEADDDASLAQENSASTKSKPSAPAASRSEARKQSPPPANPAIQKASDLPGRRVEHDPFPGGGAHEEVFEGLPKFPHQWNLLCTTAKRFGITANSDLQHLNKTCKEAYVLVPNLENAVKEWIAEGKKKPTPEVRYDSQDVHP